MPRLTVLVVDPSEETREVLRTALAHRDADVLAASRAEHGLCLARQHHPALIVLDEDSQAEWPKQLCLQYDHESQRQGMPLVVLGTARHRLALPSGEFVAKPYHYAPLIRKIEELLDQTRQPLARSA